MHKTASAPQWIWSTFEQIDNVSGAHPSFHNPRQRDGEVNRQTHSGTPNQVTRVIPIPALDPDCGKMDQAVDNVQQLNRDVQKALGDSVFRHYELIGTQWPVSTQRNEVAPSTVFQVLPELLGNTTMETFIQETSSCMGCHAMARTSKTSQFVSADFTFTLGEAFPRLPNLQQIPAPSQREAGVPKERWARVVRGYELAARTYELLPDFVPHAKLHCQSCHLNAGGNPTAAWWVGMMAKFRYPETDQLPARINQCFEQSMNGKPLCDARDRTDPNMNALIVYMQWLDEQATVRKIPMPAQPFPALSTMSGNAERGKKIFLQKCAFCHGNDGQGRYLSDTYYRPALWGKHSFNARAGMAKPATFAAFIHGNMPFGSGGELTAQEAWDIASFVDAQERPEGKRQ
jgi:cytochrome c